MVIHMVICVLLYGDILFNLFYILNFLITRNDMKINSKYTSHAILINYKSLDC